jgi:uncharacterized membrane protein YhaH (DUF805 family)
MSSSLSAEGDLTLYVGEAGEKYSDPADWRELMLDGRVTPDSVLPMRRGERLTHQRAGDAPELAAIFAQLAPAPSDAAYDGAAIDPEPASFTPPLTPPAPPPSEEWRTAEARSASVTTLGSSQVVLGLRRSLEASTPPQAQTRTTSDPPSNVGATAPIAIFVRCLTRDYARFSGRASRGEFWTFVLGQLCVALAFVVAVSVLSGGEAASAGGGAVAAGFWALFLLYSFVPALAVLFRRLHDLGASGWTALVVLIPYLGWLLLVGATLFPAQRGANRYGPAAPGGARP